MNKKITNILWILLTLVWSGKSQGALELSIEQAINLALTNSAQVKAAEADVRAQGNRQVSSWLDLGPRLSATYNHLYFDKKITKSFGPEELVVRDDKSQTGSLIISQPLSGLIGLTQAARAEGKHKALKLSALNLTKSQVAFRTAELFLRAQQNDRMWEIARASIDASLAQNQDGKALLRADRIHKGDLLKLDLAVSKARLEEAKARAAREIAHFSLLEAIGIHDPELFFVSPLKPEAEPAALTLPSLDEALSLALENRLELKQARQGQELASIARSSSYLKFFPVINFVAQWDHNFGKPGFAGVPDTKMLGFNMSWDIWNNTSHIFQVREASEKLAKTIYEGDALKQVIRIDLVQALALLKAAHEGKLLASKAQEQADEAYRIEKLNFAAGKSSATQLVLAETAKTQAAGSLISVHTEQKIQELKLQQALGYTRPVFEE